MIVFYRQNPSMWSELAIPESIKSWWSGDPDRETVNVFLHPRGRRGVDFIGVPGAMFRDFLEQWRAYKGRLR
jgi:hypothetical protein